ncbi:MAG: hypothetical protein Q9219_003773 [cf. Caloplaca sp. 3 TL-2023]
MTEYIGAMPKTLVKSRHFDYRPLYALLNVDADHLPDGFHFQKEYWRYTEVRVNLMILKELVEMRMMDCHAQSEEGAVWKQELMKVAARKLEELIQEHRSIHPGTWTDEE